MSRIEPIEHPTNLFTRFAYWMMKRRLGKVMTPAKVVYARMPKSLFLATDRGVGDGEGAQPRPGDHASSPAPGSAMINELLLLRRHREGGRACSTT